MPKIKITTDRRPWVDGKPQANGATLDVDDATADMMVANGFAEKVRGAPKKKAVLDD